MEVIFWIHDLGGNAMKTGLYVECGGVRVLLEPTDADGMLGAAARSGGLVGSPLMHRVARIAAAVVDAFDQISREDANAAAAALGGAHQTPPTVQPGGDQGGAGAPAPPKAAPVVGRR